MTLLKLSAKRFFLFCSVVASVQAQLTEQTCSAAGKKIPEAAKGVTVPSADAIKDTGNLRRLVTDAQAILTNGFVMLGVLKTGNLNTDGTMGHSPANSTGSAVSSSVGLRCILPDGREFEATSWGCPCEGWGVAFDTGEVYANKARTTKVGTSTLTDVTADSAISTITSVDGNIKVVHDYHPSPDTPYLYEDLVTITNTGTTDTNKTLFRRTFDFDLPPNLYRECVTVQPDPATVPFLTRASNDGFADANPRTAIAGLPAPITVSGPGDLGSTFDFNFGALPAGESKTFKIFYGGAPNTALAEGALGAVGAEAYAMGRPSDSAGGCADGPAVFLFAFAGVGGETLFEHTGTAGTGGDPHITTWAGEHFEYHGQCDLTLVKDDNFADGLGLDIQIRTKLVRYWSYIKSVAIKIGNDILEIEGSADADDAEPHYWINFEYQGELDTFAGFPVTQKLPSPYKRRYIIDLSSKYPGASIVFELYKEFVRVRFIGDHQKVFGNAVGLMGDYETGETVSRDGRTVMNDFTEFGDEWQVLPSEPKLFHEVAKPQFPELCIKPEDPRGERKRRLAESQISLEDAEAACAKSLMDPLSIKDCVYDIMATQDLDMVGAF